jgi:hypothetical protein
VLLQVVSVRVPFTKVTKEDGLRLLDVLSISKPDDDPFPGEDFEDGAHLPAAVQQCTGFNVAGDIVRHVGKELAVRCFVGHPRENPKEAGCRELISPVLAAAALLAGEVQMHAEYSVAGVEAHGTVDWVMNFKDFSVVVVEVSII